MSRPSRNRLLHKSSVGETSKACYPLVTWTWKEFAETVDKARQLPIGNCLKSMASSSMYSLCSIFFSPTDSLIFIDKQKLQHGIVVLGSAPWNCNTPLKFMMANPAWAGLIRVHKTPSNNFVRFQCTRSLHLFSLTTDLNRKLILYRPHVEADIIQTQNECNKRKMENEKRKTDGQEVSKLTTFPKSSLFKPYEFYKQKGTINTQPFMHTNVHTLNTPIRSGSRFLKISNAVDLSAALSFPSHQQGRSHLP